MYLFIRHSISVICSVLFVLTASAQAEWIVNKGQWPEEVKYKTPLKAGTLWTERNGFTYQFYDPTSLTNLHDDGHSEEVASFHGHAYKVRFVNGLAESFSGFDPKKQYYNYYLGSDPRHHASHCESYDHIQMHEVYPGIDVALYSVGGSLKYDWLIQPGANPHQIKWEYEGVKCSLIHRESGTDILLQTGVRTITEKQPYAYQIIDGHMKQVVCNYEMRGGVLHFQIGKYNKELPLVIDPEVAFSSFMGSVADNWGFTACDDSDGNLIAGSIVFGQDYPTTLGAYSTVFNQNTDLKFDIAIAKFNADGTNLLYSTFLGGNQCETPNSIVVDSQDRIILFGITSSPDFPTTPGAYQSVFLGGATFIDDNFIVDKILDSDGTDMYVAKFQSDGSLLASTYLGGTDHDGLNAGDQLYMNYGDTFRGEVNVDAQDNVYVASVTMSSDFPVTAGTFGGGDYDGVLLKLSPDLSNLMQSRFIGGGSRDACYVVEFNDAGQLIVAGGTQSSNFSLITPTAADATWNGETDGFIALIDPSSFTVLSGTYVGTTAYDQVYFAQSDESGFIYAYGQTEGNMPITPGLYGQPGSGQFISKFASDLGAQEWNTVIGTGNGIDLSPTAFLVSQCGQIYISGWGGDTNNAYAGGDTFDLPITQDAFQSTTDGSDFYLCVLTPNAQAILYGSFLGGNQSNEHVDGGTSRFDKNGSVYHAVCAGCQGNDDFPTTPGAWSSTNDSDNCNLAVFRFDLSAIQAEVSINGPSQVCVDDEVTFTNTTVGASNYLWNFGDGTTSTAAEPAHQYASGGTYTVELIGYDNALCVTADTATVEIEIIPDVSPTVQGDQVICAGEVAQLNATGSENLHWIYDLSLSALDVPNPTASPAVTTTYFVVDENECDAETLSVEVEVSSVNATISNDTTLCLGQSAALYVTGGVNYQWTPSDFLSDASSSNPVTSPTQNMDYTVEVVNEHGCSSLETISVIVYNDVPGGQNYSSLNVCRGSEVQLSAEPGNAWSWSPAVNLNSSVIQSPLASPADTTQYVVEITNSCGVGFDSVWVNVIHPALQVFGGGSICLGDTISAWATGALNYSWSPSLWAYPSDAAFTVLSPENTTVFEVTGMDAFNCAWTENITVSVYEQVDVEAGPDAYFNAPDSVMLYGNALGFDCYWWPSVGLACDTCEMTLASPTEPTVYHLAIVDDFGCVNEDSVLVRPFYPVYVPNTFTPNGDGVNDVFLVSGQPQTGFHLVIFDRWGIIVFESFDMKTPWTGDAGDGYFAPNDVYNWVLEFDSLDRRTKLIGHVVLAR